MLSRLLCIFHSICGLIVAIVRGNFVCQTQFLRADGLSRIFEILERTSDPNNLEKYERFNQRMGFFIFCLCQELFDEQLGMSISFRLDKVEGRCVFCKAVEGINAVIWILFDI